MNKDFALFQSEFKKWQKLFGLTGYRVYYESKPLANRFATVLYDLPTMSVSVTLNSNLPRELSRHKNARRSAKHEACHLLIARLDDCAHNRYVTREIINEATEELAVKLESLIP